VRKKPIILPLGAEAADRLAETYDLLARVKESAWLHDLGPEKRKAYGLREPLDVLEGR
jgi:hypothetical protein